MTKTTDAGSKRMTATSGKGTGPKPTHGSSKASGTSHHGLSEEELSQWVVDQIHREIAEAMGGGRK